MQFMHPNLLWLLLLIIPLTVWHVMKGRKSDPTMKIPTTSAFDNVGTSWKEWMRHVLFALEMLSLACLVVILCRPLSSNSWSQKNIDGTDIVLSIDVSSSMLARDFKPDRLAAAKEVASDFVSGRTSDNIGLVAFAGEAFTMVPMTTDIATLINSINSLEIDMNFALEDGTAVGDGIATAINRLKKGKAKSKSIILLTDGSNNTGVVYPGTAAQIARKEGIKIYTIGIGSMGTAPFPVFDFSGHIVTYENMKVEIDENSLKEIAKITGGKYFRATNKNVLKNVFAEIDKLEKSRIDVEQHKHLDDAYQPWALALLILLTLCAVIRYTVLRTIP
ncbi:MAG: VWA domain-containing protein [Muribaculaceae bacterium]|nr:VWA domain-containing protein [Muribaculaceae bacterium]MBR5118654.1 VWA domain-containing protein [Muribaculaceae bacterium]